MINMLLFTNVVVFWQYFILEMVKHEYFYASLCVFSFIKFCTFHCNKLDFTHSQIHLCFIKEKYLLKKLSFLLLKTGVTLFKDSICFQFSLLIILTYVNFHVCGINFLLLSLFLFIV